MINEDNKTPNPPCNMLVMPPPISDEDINALFSGIINIVRRKIELETKADIINARSNFEKVLKELKSKQAECARLKNEIIYLKNELKK